MQARLTRRAAIGGAAAVALTSCGGSDPPPTSDEPQAGSGAGLLGSLVALENAGVAAWAAIGGELTGDGRRYAQAIREREMEHVKRLEALVRELGGTPPEGRSAADYATSFPRLHDEATALQFARDLEERLVRAYLDALQHLPEADQRRTAAELCADEAEDLAIVHVLAGEPAAPEAFVTGAT